MDISELRGQIDRIDDELVKLFSQRMAVAAQIADFKKENNEAAVLRLDAKINEKVEILKEYTEYLEEFLSTVERGKHE